jgi:peptidoglycan-N-acetylglucosamine deacetylase
MRLFRPGFFAGCLYPEALFRIKTDAKLLYLTFDDGPDPDSTPGLLGILGRYNVKALFFCNGQKAGQHPGLIDLIISGGHLTGNHGYSHPDGWRTSSERYLEDVEKAAGVTSAVLFRPPFGHMRYRQYRKLRKRYRIVLWDIMPYDFDKSFGVSRSLNILKRKIRPGSIIVLHDNPASCAAEILPGLFEHAASRGYKFERPDF